MILHSGSVHGKYTEVAWPFRYRKAILSSPSTERTYIEVCPGRAYPRWNLSPCPEGGLSADLVDYEIHSEDGALYLWLIPNPFTEAQVPKCFLEVQASREFLHSHDIERFMLNQVFNRPAS